MTTVEEPERMEQLEAARSRSSCAIGLCSPEWGRVSCVGEC
jgi:hypothetical protein